MEDDYLNEAQHEAQLMQVTPTTARAKRATVIQEETKKEVDKQPQERRPMSTVLEEDQKRASELPERDVTEGDSDLA